MFIVCHGFGCFGYVAEKVAHKADTATPASFFKKIALMTDGRNSEGVVIIPGLRAALV